MPICLSVCPHLRVPDARMVVLQLRCPRKGGKGGKSNLTSDLEATTLQTNHERALTPPLSLAVLVCSRVRFRFRFHFRFRFRYHVRGPLTTSHGNSNQVYRPKDEDMMYLVLDRLEGGSVDALRKQRGHLEEGFAAYIMTQVVDAVRYCHSMNIAVR